MLGNEMFGAIVVSASAWDRSQFQGWRVIPGTSCRRQHRWREGAKQTRAIVIAIGDRKWHVLTCAVCLGCAMFAIR
eukprot:13480814-Alexandrium_andersonii.AAC.1